jgi:ribosomal protein S12 methylthiotransferase accessory factor YcaO
MTLQWALITAGSPQTKAQESLLEQRSLDTTPIAVKLSLAVPVIMAVWSLEELRKTFAGFLMAAVNTDTSASKFYAILD